MGAVILEGINGLSVHYTLRKVPETSSDKRLCALFIFFIIESLLKPREFCPLVPKILPETQ